MFIRSTAGARTFMVSVGNPFRYNDRLHGDLSRGCLCIVIHFGKEGSLPVGKLKKDARSQIGGKQGHALIVKTPFDLFELFKRFVVSFKQIARFLTQ